MTQFVDEETREHVRDVVDEEGVDIHDAQVRAFAIAAWVELSPQYSVAATVWLWQEVSQ